MIVQLVGKDWRSLQGAGLHQGKRVRLVLDDPDDNFGRIVGYTFGDGYPIYAWFNQDKRDGWHCEAVDE